MSQERARPQMHVIAGPNGAGKTTLYKNRLARELPNAEFVNADELIHKELGRAAQTRPEATRGQELAETRRRELMQARRDLVTESTFSHPSKLDLIKDAKAAGYAVHVHHVNVRSAELSVKRVARRVDQGGHPVPEDKIRQRYERNQPLIREAVKMADRAYLYDNSAKAKGHARVANFKNGELTKASTQIPAWARELYAQELRFLSQARQNRQAASYQDAKSITQARLGNEAKTYIARPGGSYTGKVIGETDLHVVQRVGKESAIAHFKDRLTKTPALNSPAQIDYNKEGRATVRAPAEVQRDRDRAKALAKGDDKATIKKYPELAGAVNLIKAARAATERKNPAAADRVANQLRERIARDLAAGHAPPKMHRLDRDTGLER